MELCGQNTDNKYPQESFHESIRISVDTLSGVRVIKIEAYAVICENNCIADATGKMPAELKNEAEWAFFQQGLDRADVSVLGRKSQEITPNPKNRQRLVLSRRIKSTEQKDTRTVVWNPEGATLALALELFAKPVSSLAITGGQAVFDYFLAHKSGYTQFHLSRLKNVYLEGGTKLFSALNGTADTPESLLKSAGYTPGAYRDFDEHASVVSWHKAL